MLERTQAEVFAHEADADLVEQHFPLSGLLRDGDLLDILGGLRVVHSPGHTPGSICLYSASRKVLFSGDALVNRGELSGPNPKYTPDMPRAYQSSIHTMPLPPSWLRILASRLRVATRVDVLLRKQATTPAPKQKEVAAPATPVCP